jgi:hypothetical protein
MWEAILTDGSIVNETNCRWIEVKARIVELRFRDGAKTYILPRGMDEYLQAKSASAPLGQPDAQAQVESRWIGFRKGSHLVRLRFFDRQDRILLEEESRPDHHLASSDTMADVEWLLTHPDKSLGSVYHDAGSCWRLIEALRQKCRDLQQQRLHP